MATTSTIITADGATIAREQTPRRAGAARYRDIAWLRADTITIHPDYQRRLDRAWAKKLADQFDEELLLPIAVSKRPDGTLACMAGQHRLFAIVHYLGWGDQLVECDVYEGLTLQDEARFHDATARVKPHDQLQRFRIRVEGGDARARAISDAVESAGLSIATNLGNVAGTVRAIGAIEKIADVAGLAHLTEVLTTLKESLGGDVATFNNRMLQGMSGFLVRYGQHRDYVRRELVVRLSKAGYNAIQQRAEMIMSLSGKSTGGRAATAYGRAFLHFYNHGRRTHLLPEWRENVTTAQVEERRRQAGRDTGVRYGFDKPEMQQRALAARKRKLGY